jgi:hypothetical protein
MLNVLYMRLKPWSHTKLLNLSKHLLYLLLEIYLCFKALDIVKACNSLSYISRELAL